MKKYDLIILGAGPGGYTAAIKAAELNMTVAIVDRGEVGGGCVNRGCIPTKVLLHSADIFLNMQHSSGFGVFTDGLSFDFGKMQQCKTRSVEKYRNDIVQKFDRLKIDFYQGEGSIYKEKVVAVSSDEKVEYLQGRQIIIATGATHIVPNIEGIDLPGVISSDQLLSSQKWN